MNRLTNRTPEVERLERIESVCTRFEAECREGRTNVAAYLQIQGKHEPALALFEKALEIHRKLLGEKGPTTAAGYNNVAICLQALGQYTKALPLYQRALAINRRVLGEDRSPTTRGYNGVAACLSAQGKDAGGDGLLGFAHAFLVRGARSVVLTCWQVDDSATALLMLRFYENLLGKRKGLKSALGRADALAEAKKWLRSLSRKEAGPWWRP